MSIKGKRALRPVNISEEIFGTVRTRLKGLEPLDTRGIQGFKGDDSLGSLMTTRAKKEQVNQGIVNRILLARGQPNCHHVNIITHSFLKSKYFV